MVLFIIIIQSGRDHRSNNIVLVSSIVGSTGMIYAVYVHTISYSSLLYLLGAPSHKVAVVDSRGTLYKTIALIHIKPSLTLSLRPAVTASTRQRASSVHIGGPRITLIPNHTGCNYTFMQMNIDKTKCGLDNFRLVSRVTSSCSDIRRPWWAFPTFIWCVCQTAATCIANMR